MKAKAMGMTVIAVMGLTAAGWAVSSNTTDQMQMQDTQKGNADTYYACDQHVNCTGHNSAHCSHWTRWVPGHQNRCGWSNCGNQSRGQSQRGGCCR